MDNEIVKIDDHTVEESIKISYTLDDLNSQLEELEAALNTHTAEAREFESKMNESLESATSVQKSIDELKLKIIRLDELGIKSKEA